MNIGIIVQARMGSTRLPGKVLMQFYDNQTLIEILLNNLHKVFNCKLIVASSINSDNDQLETFLKDRGAIVYRGSENDVLDRFIKAAEHNNVDGIIRICSDNPFIDWQGLEELVQKAQNSNADYIGFRINNTPSIKTHFGFWGEFVTLKALKQVQDNTQPNTPAHEHVTIHIYTHPDEFKCEWIECPDYLQGRNDIRLTIDTIEDMTIAKRIYFDLMKEKSKFSLLDVVKYLDKHKEIKESMLNAISSNQK